MDSRLEWGGDGSFGPFGPFGCFSGYGRATLSFRTIYKMYSINSEFQQITEVCIKYASNSGNCTEQLHTLRHLAIYQNVIIHLD